MKFRKKPVVVEAVQFLEGFFESATIQDFFKDAICIEVCPGIIDPARPHIHTLEGNHYVIVGDWIIKGIKGEFYPCKPDVFEKTYEPVEE